MSKLIPDKGVDDGGPAFPVGDQSTHPLLIGMSLRDYFAGQTLANPALCTGVAENWQLAVWFGKNASGITREQIVARQAQEYADAMLKARTPAK